MTTTAIIGAIAFVLLAPLFGGILAGADRIITARMQRRFGPPIFQPFYDVAKLLSKERITVTPGQTIYLVAYLACAVISGAIFFAGGNFLLVVFILTLGSLFFIIAGYASRSPYAEIGASREILQVMSYEPMVLLAAVAFYMATGSFNVADIAAASVPTVVYMPLMFIGFLFILTIKLRKSPFDISYSHHAHQEIVKGITTEMSGTDLAIVELTHWYETVMFLGWTALFVLWNGGIVAIIVCVLVLIATYIFEILIDNNFARVKWNTMFSWSWWVAFVLGSLNLALFVLIQSMVL